MEKLGSERTEFIRDRNVFSCLIRGLLGDPFPQGNRQLLSTGNLSNNRVALLLMDYPRRERLKLIGYAQVVDIEEAPELAARVIDPDMLKSIERIFRIEIVSYNWNCSQHITPRLTEEEVREATKPLLERIARLEAELATR